MDEAAIQKLRELAGDGNWSTDPLDLLSYSRDLAPVPAELLHAYGMLPPGIVLRPRDTEALAKILAFCNAGRIPVTLRGGGSSALGGVIPIEGGAVLDLCGLSRILEFSPEDGYVRVECGLEWKRLIDWLAPRGWQVGANPSSGVAATVGGYLGTGGGAGIGVPRHGVLGDQLLGLKVVLADGRIVETGPGDAWLFVGAEGTLGAVAEATLKVFRRPPEERCCMLAFNTLHDGVEAYRRIERFRPYYLHLLDRGAVRFLNRSGGHLHDAALTLVCMLQDTTAQLDERDLELERLVRETGAYWYPDDEARAEWLDRYKIELSFKRLGPTLMLQELRCPLTELEALLQELAELLAGEEWGVQSLASDRGAICLLIYVLTDERDRRRFFRALGYAGTIPALGYRHGATVYGLALHNSAHLERIHPAGAVRLMREVKQRLDPQNILNPSKTVAARVPGWASDLALWTMRHAPGLMGLGLRVAGYTPRELVRLGLRIVGGQLR